MFVNIQGALWQRGGSELKGMTFAIWGPWEEGVDTAFERSRSSARPQRVR